MVVVVVIVIIVAVYTYFRTTSSTIIGAGNNTSTSARCGYKDCVLDSDCTDVCGPAGTCGVEKRCQLP